MASARHDVRIPVEIEIHGEDECGLRRHGVHALRGEGSVAGAEVDRHGGSGAVEQCQINLSIGVEITCSNEIRLEVEGYRGRGLERPVAVSQQNA